MNQSEERYAQIRHAYFRDHAGAGQALERLDAAQSGKRGKLARLLRHHDDEPISDREVRERDGFDQLLAFLGMVEIACVATYLPASPPRDHTRMAERVLNDEAVRRYYEDYYPILLPQAHRRRMEGSLLNTDLQGFRRGPQLFDQFFTLSLPLETSGTIETFLRLLDEGARHDHELDRLVTLDDTIAVLRDPKRFLRHASARAPDRSSGELSTLSESVQGFLGFVAFAPRLLALLEDAADTPLLQSSMWHYHGYWWGQMGQRMGADVRRGLEAIDGWEARLTEVERRQFKSSLSAARGKRREQAAALAFLSSGRFSYGLAESLLDRGPWGWVRDLVIQAGPAAARRPRKRRKDTLPKIDLPSTPEVRLPSIQIDPETA